jgi:acetate kinase
MRTLFANKDPHGYETFELFVFYLAREICPMANLLGGIECLVVTGGIGEHAIQVRAVTCKRLGWLGIELDPRANEVTNNHIGINTNRVDILTIPTDEEMTIPRYVIAVIERELNDGQD